MSAQRHASPSLIGGITRRQSLHATVIRSCTQCGAPGYWHNTPGVNVGCYAPDKVTSLGSDAVGPECPCCGSPRPPVEDRGEIWSRLYGFAPAIWLYRLIQLLKRKLS